jgi:phage FluMu protein Com
VNIELRNYVTPREQRLLDLSVQETVDLKKRDLRCPYCHFLIERVYSDIRGHMETKCPKCRSVYVVNLSYFRKKERGEYITLIRVRELLPEHV